MNNDDQYIKMILALPDEFFKRWKYKDGDFIIISPHRYKEYLGEYNISGIYLCFNNLLCRKENEHTNHWIPARWVKLEDGRPIPSQEQLQEMLITFHITHNKFSRKRAILHIMGHWADYLMRKHNFEYDKIDRNQDYEYFGNPEDFDILMLRFTVGIILMLGWNGESWEKMV